MKNLIRRQGDVLVKRIAGPLPEGATEVPRENGRVVLAHGEATGHAHAIRERATMFRDDAMGRMLLDIPAGAPAPLEHDEHSTIPLPAGLYEVVRQVQWSDELEPIQRVAD